MAKIGIFFGSTDGNTERVVAQVQAVLGGETIAELINVKSATADDVQPYENLILACPTWEIGQLQEDWESFVDELADVDFNGKKVTYIGLGDADGYPDTFQDALGIIHERIAGKGCTFVGSWATEGYNFEASKGIVNGKFLGLCLDEDNQKDLTPERIEKWVAQIKEEFALEVGV
jgi:flavodoxin I